jgi:hypothetical protein
MEKYEIVTLGSGQPLILYQENETVYMYTIYSGRIQSHGKVFDDVSGQIMLASGEKHYLAYLSTSQRLRLYRLKEMRFVELLSLQNADSKTDEFVKASLVPFQGKFLLFYITHHPENSSNALFFIDLDSLQKSSLLYQGNYSFADFQISPVHNQLLISLSTKEQNNFLFLDESLQPISAKQFSFASNKNDAQIARLEKELQQKEEEIRSLKNTQKHIADQYNELAEYSGQLQEELRKVRYL